jgi:hypothetical protein
LFLVGSRWALHRSSEEMYGSNASSPNGSISSQNRANVRTNASCLQYLLTEEISEEMRDWTSFFVPYWADEKNENHTPPNPHTNQTRKHKHKTHTNAPKKRKTRDEDAAC